MLTCPDPRKAGLQAVARGFERGRLKVALRRTDVRVARLHGLQLAGTQLGLCRHELPHAPQRPARPFDSHPSQTPPPTRGGARGRVKLKTEAGAPCIMSAKRFLTPGPPTHDTRL